MIKIGIDLGGTKTEIVALDTEGNELLRHRIKTPQSDYPSILHTIVDLVHSAEREIGRHCSVGVGTPGVVSTRTGWMKNSNSVCLNGKPLLQDLERLLKRPLRMSNDANCFALSEATDGAAAGSTVVFAVIIGTGTGAGIAVNGQILSGINDIAGEWGHNPLPWPGDAERPGPDCYCGKQGCIETFLSGHGMARDHYHYTGEQFSPERIVEFATTGNQQCEETLQRYEDRMARSLAHVMNILDPDVIVLGGGMGQIKRLYGNVPKLWGRYVFSENVETKLVAPKHGDASGVRGAAWLFR